MRDEFLIFGSPAIGEEEIAERTLSLPLSPKVTDRDVEDVIEALREVLA